MKFAKMLKVGRRTRSPIITA